MSEDKKKDKDIEIISGDGTNLVISPVYEHINAAKPKSKDKKPKYIIVPGQKKEQENDNDKNENSDN